MITILLRLVGFKLDTSAGSTSLPTFLLFLEYFLECVFGNVIYGLKMMSFQGYLQFWKQEKSGGAKSGEYGGWGKMVVCCFAK